MFSMIKNQELGILNWQEVVIFFNTHIQFSLCMCANSYQVGVMFLLAHDHLIIIFGVYTPTLL